MDNIDHSSNIKVFGKLFLSSKEHLGLFLRFILLLNIHTTTESLHHSIEHRSKDIIKLKHEPLSINQKFKKSVKLLPCWLIAYVLLLTFDEVFYFFARFAS